MRNDEKLCFIICYNIDVIFIWRTKQRHQHQGNKKGNKWWSGKWWNDDLIKDDIILIETIFTNY